MLRVGLKIRIHGCRIRKVARIAHHVIRQPETKNKPLPIAEALYASLRLLLNDITASLNHPILVFRHRAHGDA